MGCYSRPQTVFRAAPSLTLVKAGAKSSQLRSTDRTRPFFCVGCSLAASLLRTALARPPAEADVHELADAAAQFRQIFERNTKGATALVNTGDSEPDPSLDTVELAAWTMVANVVLNRDDFLNK